MTIYNNLDEDECYADNEVGWRDAEIERLKADNARLRAALERAVENIANKRMPRQNIAGPIRAELNKTL